MFSQQVASNLTESPGKSAVASTDEGEDWGTAERYYRNGRFRFIAAVIPTEPAAHIATAIRTDDAPAVFVSTITQAEEPAPPVAQIAIPTVDEPAAPSELKPDLEPEIPTAEPVATTPQEPPVPEIPELPAFGTLVQEEALAPADEDTAPPTESEALPGNGGIDVLPLPLDNPSGEIAEFGTFSDDLGVPKSDSTPSSGDAASEQQYTQADPYAIPSGRSMRYVDPRDLVRQRAVEKAENRSRRIEARKWMGYDPLRPSVTAVPYTTVPTRQPTLLVIPIVVQGGR